VAHPLRLDVALFLTQEQKVVRTGRVGKAMSQAVDEKERGPRKALGWFGVITSSGGRGSGVQKNQTESASLTFLYSQDALASDRSIPA
jgi:hypothetical protein